MEKFLQQQIFDNTIQTYLLVTGIILLAVLIKRLLSKYLALLLFKLLARYTGSIGRQSFLDLVVQPIGIFFATLVSLIALDKLTFPAHWDFRLYHITLKQFLDSLAAAAIIIIFIWLCLRVIDFIALVMKAKANLSADHSDNQLVIFFKDFFKVILVLIGILLVLRFSFNKNIGNLLTGLSIVGAAVALATRESLENLIASFIIFFDRPFMIGDLVRVNNFTGTIEKIGLRSTRIRTTEKTYISVPNKQMVDTIVDNITLRTQRKAELRLELGLATTAEQVSRIIQGVKQILEKPAIENKIVFLLETGRNAHVISVEYFTSILQSLQEFNLLREEVNLAIINLLESNDVELAASNTEIVVKSKPAPGQNSPG